MKHYSPDTVYEFHALLIPYIDFSTPLIFRQLGEKELADFLLFKLNKHLSPENGCPPDPNLLYFSEALDLFIKRFFPEPSQSRSLTLANVMTLSFSKMNFYTEQNHSWVHDLRKLCKDATKLNASDIKYESYIKKIRRLLFKHSPEEKITRCLNQFIIFGQRAIDFEDNEMNIADIAKMFSPCFVRCIFQELNDPKDKSSRDQLKRFYALFTAVIEDHYRQLLSSPSLTSSIASSSASASSSTSPSSFFVLPAHASTGPIMFSVPSLSSLSDLYSPQKFNSAPAIESSAIKSEALPLIRSPTDDLVQWVMCNNESQQEAIVQIQALLQASPDLIQTRALMFNRPLLHLAVLKKNNDIFNMLLKSGANWLAADKHRDLPLHIAVWKNNLFAVKQLLDAGHAIEQTCAKNIHGETPLHIAAKKQNKICIEMLLAINSQDIHELDNNGNTPLQILTQSNATSSHYEEILLMFIKRISISKGSEERFQLALNTISNKRDKVYMIT
jgi:ankyrin repeat protein